MKSFKKNLATIIFVFVLGFAFSDIAFAATTPYLGATATYGVVSSTYTGNVASTNVTGNVCYTTGPGTFAPTIGSGSLTVPCTNGADQNYALANINAQVIASCTSLGAGAVDLNAIDVGSGLGVFPAGCYTSGGAMNIAVNQSITLTGSGTHIFKPGGALTTQNNTSVILSGASACDVFWAPVGATTLGAYTTGGIPPAGPTFVGTIFRGDGNGLSITLGHFANLLGRTLAFGSTVTTDANTIAVPTGCVATPAPAGATVSGGGPLVSQIPPLIDVTKIPSLLSLLSTGGGSVAFDYAVTNIGIIPMSNVVVKDNKCAPVTFLSGDTNNDLKLDVNETWHYRCTANVLKTTTNTVTATGQANGYTAIDTTDATVAVGVPLDPPLIHVVKKPSVFVLPVGGGPVTYIYTVTNPGVAPLSNVNITDDKCTGLPGRVLGHPGDLNKNDLLENNEVWNFTCQTNLTQTTTNTATAQGSANGLTAVDHSFATVAVALPTLPKTGFPPAEKSNLWDIIFQKLTSFFF